MRPGHPAVALSVVLAFGLVAGRAQADERAECARSYEQAQRLQQRGENKKALAAAERCAQPSCPALLAEECKPWITQIRGQLSRLDVRVTGADGCAATETAIEIDRVKQPLSAALFVDPGIHEVRVLDAATHRIADKTINAVAGETHVVELGLAPAGTTCSATNGTPSGGISKVAVGLGIAGGALLLTGAVFGVAGAMKRSDLESCKPNCSSEDIDGARSLFFAGDVIGAVGLLTFGAAAAVFFLTRGDTVARSSALEPTPRGLRIRF